MRFIVLGIGLVLLFISTEGITADSSGSCPPQAYSRHRLSELESDGFKVANEEDRQQLALSLTACLASPDSYLRDKIAYSAFSAMLRRDELNNDTKLALFQRLLGNLEPHAEGIVSFESSFSALVLSELARADRMQAYLSPDQLGELVAGLGKYLGSISDYRGFDAEEGWRHGVAHAADVALQLTLNDRIDEEALTTIVDSVMAKVAPTGEHFYIYGESTRLARPVLYAAQRGLLSDDFWQTRFERLASPEPNKTWGDAYWSQRGLAKLHNTRLFANAIVAALASTEAPVFDIVKAQNDRLREMVN